jgi:hypothetical protein
MPKVVVAWGNKNAKILEELSKEEHEKWMCEHVNEIDVKSYEFATKEEAKAFLLGISEAQGWFDFNSLML